MILKQHFRGVVWPSVKDGLHRYVVIGMLVTDEPIEELTGDQIVLDGHAAGMPDVLAAIMQKPSNFRGDANSVLLSLESLIES